MSGFRQPVPMTSATSLPLPPHILRSSHISKWLSTLRRHLYPIGQRSGELDSPTKLHLMPHERTIYDAAFSFSRRNGAQFCLFQGQYFSTIIFIDMKYHFFLDLLFDLIFCAVNQDCGSLGNESPPVRLFYHLLTSNLDQPIL